LDRKYGNLVNMIQGLGQKHQAWLPEEPEDAIEEEPDAETNVHTDAKKDSKVEKWANRVSASLEGALSPHEEEPAEQALDEARSGHFDRPFKEVRVGESPSRPWGISIPAKYTNAESSSSVGSAPTASPPLPLEVEDAMEKTPKQPGKCPFDHKAMAKMAEQRASQPAPPPLAPSAQPAPSTYREPPPKPEPRPELKSEPRFEPPPQASEPRVQEQDAPRVVPQMIFNGPVFLGYPPDQLIALLQNSNLGAGLR
jgi:hypothetical protein